MTPLEAMQMLISVAKGRLKLKEEFLLSLLPGPISGVVPDAEDEQLERALTMIQKMLDTALPVAKFRCFVSVDKVTKLKGPITEEFTICSPTITGILAGLLGLTGHRTDVHATLWMQSTASADMVSGFQGMSKSPQYKAWLLSLSRQYGEIKPPSMVN